jgi:hypothetical protein
MFLWYHWSTKECTVPCHIYLSLCGWFLPTCRTNAAVHPLGRRGWLVMSISLHYVKYCRWQSKRSTEGFQGWEWHSFQMLSKRFTMKKEQRFSPTSHFWIAVCSHLWLSVNRFKYRNKTGICKQKTKGFYCFQMIYGTKDCENVSVVRRRKDFILQKFCVKKWMSFVQCS